ncbi:MAG: hypothetical protein H6721_09740 [Sandaracinus sp.]|nr:hypothetical protein [Sandaracinus sp.]MCB9611996.1 hypothetical protein [Sandaracinus sp.]MCB9632396.1 hypothetical protein [Sandaracinus sp.]
MRRLLACLLCLAACGDDDTAPPDGGPPPPDAGQYEVPEGCNPLAATWDCLLPFPSNHFREADATLPSGARVTIPEVAQVRYRERPFDYFADRALDGFSPAGPMVAFFPVRLDPEPLVRWDEDVTATTRGEGPSVIVNAETGERIPHFAELDASAVDPDRRVLLLRPMVRLEPTTRYVVGLRGLVDEAGALAPTPEGFRRLRDADPAADAALATRYDAEVFPALTTAGFSRDELQLAWDFTTGSDTWIRQDMLDVRALAQTALEEGDFEITVREVIEGDALAENLRDSTARQVELDVRAPSILTTPEAGQATIRRDASGRVMREGDVTFPVSLLVPKRVADRSVEGPVRLLQYGHGFFGKRDELLNSYVDDFAEEYGFVAMAADWWGMMREDRDEVAIALGDARPGEVFRFVERTHQGLLNFMILAGAAEEIAALPELRDETGPLFDASATYFWGNSQGHILGGTFTSLDPTIERATLSVGGANFSLIMFRSLAFVALRLLIDINVPDDVDRQKFATFLQHWLDRIDPLSYAELARREPLEGNPSKHFLLHTGPGDDAVTFLAAELHARELGIPLLEPSPFSPPLLERTTAPADSALVELDYDVDILVTPEAPMESNPIHEAIRRNPRVQQQVDAFFRADGQVTQTCDGPCDPE